MALGYEHAAGLTRYVFRAPRWYNSVAFAIVAGAIAGLGAFGDGLSAAWEGILYIGVPAVVATFATTPLDRLFGGNMTWNRSAFLALLCESISIILVSVAAFFQKYFGFTNFVYDALIASLAVIFGLRFLVLMSVSRDSVPRTLVPASLHTVVGAGVLYTYTGFFDISISASYFQNLMMTCVVYVFGAYAFVRLIDRPMKKGVGVSGFELLRGFMGYLAEGTNELEEVFEDMGEEVIVPVSVLSFRKPDGDEKARFVLPMVHPGIVGEIGGGNMPLHLAEASPSLCFVPHATADHDFNPVSQREVERINKTVEKAAEGIEYSTDVTKSDRMRCGDSKMLGQRFGDDVLLVTTCSPNSCDDIRFSVGMSAKGEARVEGADDVMLVDAHNCCSSNSGAIVDPGSIRSYNLMECSGEMTRNLMDERSETSNREAFQSSVEPLKLGDGGEDSYPLLGVADSETEWDRSDGMGPLGVRVSVLEVDGQRTAYILVDGNNMVPMLREQIVKNLDDMVDSAEVMTTDTHVVNQIESHNRIGEHIPNNELIDLITSLTEEAIEDLEPVEAGMNSERTRVVVFGNDRIERLATTTNAVASIGIALAIVTTLSSLLLSAIIFLLN